MAVISSGAFGSFYNGVINFTEERSVTKINQSDFSIAGSIFYFCFRLFRYTAKSWNNTNLIINPRLTVSVADYGSRHDPGKRS